MDLVHYSWIVLLVSLQPFRISGQQITPLFVNRDVDDTGIPGTDGINVLYKSHSGIVDVQCVSIFILISRVTENSK